MKIIKNARRSISLLLVLVIVIGLIPPNIFAADELETIDYGYKAEALDNSLTDQEAYDSDFAALTMESILGENSVPDNITKDMYFPSTGNNGTTIEWEDSLWIFWPDGRIDLDYLSEEYGGTAETVITATLKKGSVEGTKEFTVTARIPSDENAQEAFDSDYEALTLERILGQNKSADNVTKNMVFPETGENGTKITWENDPYIFWDFGNRIGQIDLDELERYGGETLVTITATLKNGAFTGTKEFIVTARMPETEGELTNQEAYDLDFSNLTLDRILGQNTDQYNVTEDLVFPAAGENGTTFEWENNPYIFWNSGLNSGQIDLDELEQYGGETLVTITAYLKNGSVKGTKTFKVIARMPNNEYDSLNEDEKAINVAKAYLNNKSVLAGNESIHNIFTTLNLPEVSENGCRITWSSSPAGYIASDGTVTRPPTGSDNIPVSLTATIFKGQITDTLSFELTILARTKALDEVENAAALLSLGDTSGLKTDLILPSTLSGYFVLWESSDSSVITDAGVISRPGLGEESRSAILTATIGRRSDIAKKSFDITVLPLTEEDISAKNAARALAEEKIALIPNVTFITYETLNTTTPLLNEALEAVENAKAAGWSTADIAKFEGYATIKLATDAIALLPRDITVSVLGAELDRSASKVNYLEKDFLSPIKVKIPADMDVLQVMCLLRELNGFPMNPKDENYNFGGLSRWPDSGGNLRWMYFIDGSEEGEQWSDTILSHNQVIKWAYTSFANPINSGFPSSKSGYDTPLPMDKPIDYDLTDPTLYAINWLDGVSILGDNTDLDHINSNVLLPDKAPNNVKIVWESSNTAVIDNNGRLVNYYLQSGDKNVTLTATVALDVYINAYKNLIYPEYSKTININVVAPVLSNDEKAVALVMQELSLGDTSLITENLRLPLSGSLSTNISWSSSKPELISNSGEINRPAFGTANGTAELTATISKNNAKATKTFTVTVKSQEAAGQTAVDADYAELTFERIKGTNSGEMFITDNLVLPVKGYQGSIISWSATPTGAISSDGIVTRPQPGEPPLPVILTATVSKDGAAAEKVFELTLIPMNEKEAAVTDAEKLFALVPSADDITEASRDELQALSKVKVAEKAYDSAIKAGALTTELPGYSRVLEAKKKMSMLPAYVTISIMGVTDYEQGDGYRVEKEYGYFHKKVKVRVPPGWSLMQLTKAIAEMDGSEVVITFGGGYLDTMYNWAKCWMYGGVADRLGAFSGAATIPDHGDMYWWYQVYTKNSTLEMMKDTGYDMPIEGPPTLNLWNVTPDKSALNALIKQAEQMNKTDYRDYASWANSWTTLVDAMNYAKKVNASDAIQYDIDKAYNTLLIAINGMELINPDMSSLLISIAKAESLIKDDYKEGWPSFENALKVAHEVAGSIYSSKKEITDAEKNLSAAIAYLVPADSTTDKSQLKDAISNAENLLKEDFTEISWKRLEAALNNARAIDVLGTASQEQVEEALTALQGAMDQLLPSIPSSINSKIAVSIETIGERLIGSVEPWEVMDMAYADRASEINKADFLASAVKIINSEWSTSTDLQRTAIALTSLGIDITKIEDGNGKVYNLLDKIVNDSRDLQVNALAFALIAVDSGSYKIPEGSKWTRAKLVQELLDMQLSDNSWNWSKELNTGDVDMTAMVISALAPYYTGTAAAYGEKVPGVTASVDSALAFLKLKQNSNGSFGTGSDNSPSTGNSNSTSMVILAGTALGKDPSTEFSKVIRPNPPVLRVNIFNGLFTFATSNYSFGFTSNTIVDGMSSEQAFRALLAYQKYLTTKTAQSPYRFAAPTSGSIVDKTVLGSKIAELEKIQQGDYSNESWEVFRHALANAIAVMAAPTVNQTQKTIDDSFTALMTAYRALSNLKDTDAPVIHTTANNQTVKNSRYTFEAYADDMIDGRLMTTVTVNGVLITGNNNQFAAALISGQNIITITATDYSGNTATLTLYVVYSSDPSQPSGDITVSFKLNGAKKEKLPSQPLHSETWVAQTTVTVPDGSNVYDVFKMVLDDRKIEFVETMTNYIGRIKSPLTGEWLSEFTNGPLSGWKYMVNDVYPGVGLRDYYLKDGDNIVWVYTNNYKKDSDYNPDWDIPNGNGASGTTVIETTADSNGNAVVNIDTSAIKETLDGAIAKNSAEPEVKIVLNITGNEKSVSINLKTGALMEICKVASAKFTIESGIGTLTFDAKTLEALIGNNGENTDVTISINKIDNKQLTEEQQEVVRDGAIFDLSMYVNGNSIHDFDKAVTVFLPFVPSADIDPDSLTVYYLSENGEAEHMKDTKYDKDRKGYVLTTNHFSVFFIAPKMIFTDVTANDWFYDAVKYVFGNNLMHGSGDNKFAPNSTITRAMIVQILYNIEKNPAITGPSEFNDIKEDQWFYKAVLWAKNNKIVTGYGNGLFGPDDAITREQMMIILYNYAIKKELDISKTSDLMDFTDAAKVSNWASNGVKWAVGSGLVNGKGNSILDPSGKATRAETAVIMKHFAENFIK